MTIGENALAGFQAGAGSRSLSGIGGFIREKLAEARQKGLLGFKEGLEGGKTKKVFQASATGGTVPITFGEDEQTDFAKGDVIFSPSEGQTEGARQLASEEDLFEASILKARRLAAEQESAEGNVVEQGGSRSLAETTASGLASEDIQARQRAIQFLKENGAPVTQANIDAVIRQQQGQ